MSNKYAIFVSSNGGYIPCLNAFLNSLEKRAGKDDVPKVYLVHWEMPEAYLEACKSSFSFEVEPIAVNPADFTNREFSNMEICKSSRYHYMKEISVVDGISVACLMDCDIMVVNPDFFNLFEMVEGTGLAIGCNERFKWDVGDSFHYSDGSPLFDSPRKLFKFHCNTPLLLGNPGGWRWQGVLEKYMKIVYQAVEDHPKKGECKVGDIFAWNFAVNLCEMEDQFTLFPMDVMTQVHQTAYRPQTLLQKSGDYYHTFSGDPVLSLHGRCGTKGFGQFKTSIGVEQPIIDRINEMFRQEWYDLNFRQTVKLTDYVPMKELWEEWLKGHGWEI